MTSPQPIFQEDFVVDKENEKRPLKYSPSKENKSNSQHLLHNDQLLSSSIPPSSPSSSIPNQKQSIPMQTTHQQNKKMHKNNHRNKTNNNSQIEIAIDNNTHTPNNNQNINDINDNILNNSNNDIVLLYDRNTNYCQHLISTIDIYDKHYSQFVHTWQPSKIVDILLLLPTFLFSFIGIFLVTLVYAYFLHTLSYFIYAVTTLMITEGIKFVIRRPRPDPETFADVVRIVNLSGILIARASTSMPSGDTVQSAVLIICLSYVSDAFSYWYMFLIPVVGFGRVYFQKHYIGDVVVGGMLGIVLGFVLNVTLDRVISKLHV